MTRLRCYITAGAIAMALASSVRATTFRFDTDPFAGTNVLNTQGRQIVGGEDFINFSIPTDTFSLESTVFGVGNSVHLANASASTIPTSGVNVVVLQTFDNDTNPLTPFGAGNAADLIADRITTSGPGFFLYFNQSLDLPRLVYSTDLSDHNADLKILARMLNLNGADGRNAISTFTAANFAITNASNPVPEPSTLPILMGLGLVGMSWTILRRKRVHQRPASHSS